MPKISMRFIFSATKRLKAETTTKYFPTREQPGTLSQAPKIQKSSVQSYSCLMNHPKKLRRLHKYLEMPIACFLKEHIEIMKSEFAANDFTCRKG
mmetsp:Transcript_41810/g.48813  ORF Transcript_41810/g.48813 Transcript_41810/m.48813 type:complete len:95 (-) Transcript_41810:159-443(-)